MYESAKSELDFMTPEIKDVIQSKFGEFNIALSHSSTKEDKEHTFVKFVQNRIVMFDSSIPHMAWNNHGNDLTDGRLTINGFCDCDNNYPAQGRENVFIFENSVHIAVQFDCKM